MKHILLRIRSVYTNSNKDGARCGINSKEFYMQDVLLMISIVCMLNALDAVWSLVWRKSFYSPIQKMHLTRL